jgi:very-short-patch-repair endonuclease
VDADRRVADLAAEQRALITQHQALECGWSRTTLHRRRMSGRIQAVYPGVFALAGAPPTWQQRLLGACLAIGRSGAASHRSAARLWGLLDGDQPIEVSVPLARAPRLPDVSVHRSTDLTPEQVVRRHGMPVTNPLRTMVDLGAVLGPEEVEVALERGLVARLYTVAAIENALDALARSGRSGCGVLRRVLDERALGTARPDGLLEPRMARLLRDADLPPAHFQHVVRDDGGRFIARVDFAYPASRLAVEVDGWATHASRGALQSDLDRQNRLLAAGWTPIRFTWHDVVRRPTDVARMLRSFLAR